MVDSNDFACMMMSMLLALRIYVCIQRRDRLNVVHHIRFSSGDWIGSMNKKERLEASQPRWSMNKYSPHIMQGLVNILNITQLGYDLQEIRVPNPQKGTIYNLHTFTSPAMVLVSSGLCWQTLPQICWRSIGENSSELVSKATSQSYFVVIIAIRATFFEVFGEWFTRGLLHAVQQKMASISSIVCFLLWNFLGLILSFLPSDSVLDWTKDTNDGIEAGTDVLQRSCIPWAAMSSFWLPQKTTFQIGKKKKATKPGMWW